MNTEEIKVCPNCKSDNLVKLGKYGKDEKQRYGCIDCKDNGREPWTFYEQPTNNIEKFYCPNEGCGSQNVIRKGIINGRQRYACLTCKDNGREPWTFYETKQKPYSELTEEELDERTEKSRQYAIEHGGIQTLDADKVLAMAEEYERKQTLKSPEQRQIEEEQHRKGVEEYEKSKLVEQPKEIDKPVKKENEDICPECGSELYIKNKKAICKECGEEYEWRD